MRLLDRVSQLAPRGIVEFMGKFIAVPRAEELRSTLPTCPLRYVLSPDVASFCLKTALNDATFLRRSADLVRVPSETLWVEWSTDPSQEVALGDINSGLCIGRCRVGLYVTSERGGRAGQILICSAQDTNQETFEIAPFQLRFDFDQPALRDAAAPRLPRPLTLSLPQRPDLCSLLSFTDYELLSPWTEALAHASPDRLRRVCRPAMLRTVLDFPMFWAFLAALSARNAVVSVPTDLDTLNASRKRRGKAPLLSHLEVRSALGTIIRGGAPATHYDRASPRLHFVRGHMVRRRDAIFWRSGHFRGHPERGQIETRTVTVDLSRGVA
jgi:hypothetical protein